MEMQKENNILFRCSRLGELMTGLNILTEKQKELLAAYSERNKGIGKPLTENQLIEFGKLLEKSKSNDISETAKTFVLDTFLQKEFGYSKVITSDAMMKGLLLESDAIALVSKHENKFYKKNKERKSNDYVMGELDVKASDHIKDIKVSQNIETYAKVNEVSKQYYFQALGYMWLWNIPKYSLTYVLLTDSEEMIERQCSRLSFHLVGEDYEVAKDQIIHNNKVIEKLFVEFFNIINNYENEVYVSDVFERIMQEYGKLQRKACAKFVEEELYNSTITTPIIRILCQKIIDGDFKTKEVQDEKS